jgi:P4 family phage/plasmid primase-like protien
LPYRYDPKADCPEWKGVLNRNLEGDQERIDLLQEWFGYCLVRTTDAQKFLILVGEGGNGKSVILAALHAVLGRENVSTVPLEALGKPFQLTQTLRKLANICPEIGEIDKTDEGTLKAFVSGDTMTFERKFKDPFSAPPTARLVIATNNVPRFQDRSEGVWRRLIILPMNVKIPPEERKAGMDKPGFWLRSGELPGILNWAIEGLWRLRKNRWEFTYPALSRGALEDQRQESNPARRFLEEHFVEDQDDYRMKAGDVYRAYKEWCEREGHRRLANNVFGREVRRVFKSAVSETFRFPDGRHRGWKGFRLKCIGSA